MDYKEASEWLAGERSMVNSVPQDPISTWNERIARADSAMMEQAYWSVSGNRIQAEVDRLRAEKQALVGIISKAAESINGIGHQLNYIENNAEKAALYLIAAELHGAVSPTPKNKRAALRSASFDCRAIMPGIF